MGNSLVELCTGDSNLQGLSGPPPDLVSISPAPSTIEIETALAVPSRSPAVEQVYQTLLAQRAVEPSLEGQKDTLQPLRVTVFEESAVYVGCTKNGRPHGPGQLYFDSHKYLEGIFKEGEVDCEDGLLIDPNATYYRGAFRNSHQNGRGTLVTNDSRITAQFQNGLAHGKGLKLFTDGRIYSGQFRKGKMDGKGTLRLPNGDEYSGYFRQDAREGVGQLSTAQYEYYGPFRADRKEGKGTVLFRDGSKFEGWFQDDRIEGYGEWHRLNGTIDKGDYSQSLPS